MFRIIPHSVEGVLLHETFNSFSFTRFINYPLVYIVRCAMLYVAMCVLGEMVCLSLLYYDISTSTILYNWFFSLHHRRQKQKKYTLHENSGCIAKSKQIHSKLTQQKYTICRKIASALRAMSKWCLKIVVFRVTNENASKSLTLYSFMLLDTATDSKCFSCLTHQLCSANRFDVLLQNTSTKDTYPSFRRSELFRNSWSCESDWYICLVKLLAHFEQIQAIYLVIVRHLERQWNRWKMSR